MEDMKSNENYQLDVWKGDWGLPSVDIHCLQVLAYAKFSDIPLVVNTTCNPFKTPHGRLPVLRTNINTLDSIQDMVNFFTTRNFTPDSFLSPKQCAEIVSYDFMLRENFYPALQFIWWLDEKNFTELIRPWYAKAIPFPLNFYYPSQYEKRARSMVESLFPVEDEMSVVESRVYSEAQKCITVLSTRLGESDYFFGSKPTSLDALVYSYLAPLLKIPLPNPALQNHLKACTNLVKFVARITQRYFGCDYQNYEKAKTKKNEKGLSEDSEDDFPHKRRDQMLAGIVATVAMVSYAIFSGIIEVSTEDDDDMDNYSGDYLSEPDVED